MQPTIIQASAGWSRISLSHLFSYREILFMLLRRNLKIRYAQTFLGVGWIVFQPLFTVLLFSLIFGKWIRLSSDGAPYFFFAFTGLAAWICLSNCIQRCSNVMLLDSRMITKVYFPRLLMPIASLFESLIDLCILILILLVFMTACSLPLTWKLLLLPLWIAPLSLLALGIGSLFSALGVYYRDIIALLPFFLQTWMYCSPIVYSTSAVPEKWLGLYRLNPMVGILEVTRWSFLGTRSFPLDSFLMACGLSLFIATFGLLVFCRLERNFADML